MKIETLFKSEAYRLTWTRFWMRFAGLGPAGRLATRFATWFGPPHKASYKLAYMTPMGYIAPSVIIYHSEFQMGKHVLLGDRVVIYQAREGGPITLGDRVGVLRDSAMETGYGGAVTIGAATWIQPRCQINAYLGSIQIGEGVDIAPNCALYSYDHGFSPGVPIRQQPLRTKGDIIIENNAWLGVGVIVLSGVRIGEGAVVGAGSVVTRDIPANALAYGNPARVITNRNELK